MAFFTYFGDGPDHRISLLSYFRYLRAKHLWAFRLNKLILKLIQFHPKRLLKFWKILKLKKPIHKYFLMEAPTPESNRIAEHHNENLKNSLIENSLLQTQFKPTMPQQKTSSSLPRITVIVGVLNMERYLAAAFESVIQQNYPNVELIVMDGGSTDGTLNIIKQYEKHISFWKSGKDKGHSDACNKAIDIATGDFIILLNADDILGENLLNKAAAIYLTHPNTQVITCGVRIVENDAEQNEQVLKEIIDPEKLQITLSNILFELPVINARFFHKNIFQNFGKFQATHADGSYNLSNDRDFLIRLALANVRSEIIPEPLYLYLSHNESLTFSQKNMTKSREEHLLLADKFLQKDTLSLAQKKLFRAWLANESVYLSLIYLRQFSLKKSFLTAKYGIYHCGLIWAWDLYVILIKSISKKAKKKFFRQKNLSTTNKINTKDSLSEV